MFFFALLHFIGSSSLPVENQLGKNMGNAELHFLPLSTKAACLDGSPYGFYFLAAPNNSTKWTINIQGGGWCYNEVDCYGRSKTDLGSSTKWPKTSKYGCGCMNVKEDGMNDECNCVYFYYCDGASFSGYREDPWLVPNTTEKLYFRGIKNLDVSIGTLMKDFKFGDATEVVITGGSAGGLSTFLHTDRIRSRFGSQVKFRAAPVVGFFLDHDNYAVSDQNYTAWMKYIYHMQNLAEAGGLTPKCLQANRDNPHFCFMSPHMQSFIETPYFMFNSKYDQWQVYNELQLPCYTQKKHPCSENEKAALLKYGNDFMEQFKPVRDNAKHGAAITSCICHGCPWTSLTFDGSDKNAYEHYADWFIGKTTGTASIHVDSRGPNGDGEIKSPACEKYP